MKNILTNEIIEREWIFFQQVNNTDGRANCQDNKPEFTLMRLSQWENLPIEILNSYLLDLKNAILEKRNLIFEKYAHMMKYSVPKEYEQIEKYLPIISNIKSECIERIVDVYLNMEIETIKNYPNVANIGRPLRKEEDKPNFTSIETYLRGELLSYSENTLNLYEKYIIECKNNSINLPKIILESILQKKGYSDIDEAEKLLKNDEL